MPHFKNTDNDLFWLDEGDDAQTWLPGCAQITDAEAATLRAAKQQATFNALTYAEKRAAEYPAIGDQLDDLFHAGLFSDEMMAKIQAIKDKYPKGAE